MKSGAASCIRRVAEVRRFFADPELLRENPATLSGDLFRHIATVLRLKAGDSFVLADGCGHEAVATIREVGKGIVTVDLGGAYRTPADAGSLEITLCQGLPKGEKMDLILQKGAELGVSQVQVFNADRSVARLDSGKSVKRVGRWEKILLEAARQSGRSSIPGVGFHDNLSGVLKAEGAALKLLLWEGEKEQGLREVIERNEKPLSVSIIVGPEGGLSSKEAELAVKAGYVPVTLGKRILRTETAGLAAMAILQYIWGDLG